MSRKSFNPNPKKHFKKASLDSVDVISKKLLNGDIEALSKSITLIESANPELFAKGQEVLDKVHEFSRKSFRLGVSGVPGVGKSTFIEALGKEVLKTNKKIAVLAVDPSSKFSKGSILGDKTRMAELSNSDQVFIRPTSAGNNLGGVATRTYEAILLCEAAGFDFVIIETVGVGQSETEVFGMVDFFLLLLISGAGDELQGVKRGIMEMAHLIAVNKYDGDNMLEVDKYVANLNHVIDLLPDFPEWKRQVKKVSSLEKAGIKEILDLCSEYEADKSQQIQSTRKIQNVERFKSLINEQLLIQFQKDSEKSKKVNELVEEILANKILPIAGVNKLFKA